MIIEKRLWPFRREKWDSPWGKAASPEDEGSVLIAEKYGNPAKRESSANDYSRAARSRRMEIGSRNEILSSN